MKAIPDSVYEALTAEERVRAAVAAQARDDDAELDRLRRTCPRRIMSCTDPAYSDTMEDMMKIAILVEGDLRGLALSHVTWSKMKPLDWEYRDLLLEQAAAITAAWETILVERGIDPLTMEKALPEKHPGVKVLLKLSEGMSLPEETAEWVAYLKSHFR